MMSEQLTITIISVFIVGMLTLVIHNYINYLKNKKARTNDVFYNYLPSKMLEKHVKQLITTINSIRLSENIPVVYEDRRLSQLADMRAKEITKDMSHSGFPGILKDLKEQGIDASGEILAKGFHGALGAVNGFLNSPAHKEIMLTAKFQYIGAGIEYDSDGVAYYAVLFGYDKEK